MRNKKILYLGLDPTRHHHLGEIFHFPIIEIIPKPFIGHVKACFERLDTFSHVIVTSRSAAQLYVDYASQVSTKYQMKTYISVGLATTACLNEKGISDVLTAQEQTGEGVIALMQHLDLRGTHLFFPHSSLARNLISDYCAAHSIALMTLDLYDTVPTQKVLPNLADFDQIMFTSPSTVEAFFAKVSHVPSHIHCHAIGPITQQSLDLFL